jgi:hypothetical protein
MRHMGYADRQISQAEAETHESAGCEREDPGWNCWLDNGLSRHPLTDKICEIAEILRVGFEAVDL